MTTKQLTQQLAVIELCGSLGLNTEYCLEMAERYNVDARQYLLSLDSTEDMRERIEIGQSFLLAIRPF